jgi:O-succinylbenzoic acid--CoA ligase
MEAGSLMPPGFRDEDAPVLMGESGDVSCGIPALVYFKTSGSSGEPKWIGLSRDALRVSADAVNRHLGVEASSVWALALPIEHVGGFGVVMRAVQAGCGLERFERKWSAPEFVAWLASVQATHLSLVPTQVHDLVTAGLAAPSCLRAVVVGGGCLSLADGRAARELGWPVLASYGMTEAGSQIATQGLELLDSPYSPEPLGLLPCWEARAGGSGRIEIRGEALFRGWLRQESSGWRFEERQGDWFVTSDSGSVEGSEIRIAGRADALVKILGELVDPAEVQAEIVAASAGAIGERELAVVAVDDARAGKRLVLVHERSVPSEAIESALLSYHAQCLGFRRIGATVAVDQIPRSPLGKPLASELSRIAEEAVN